MMIELDGLSKTYGSLKAVDDLSLAVPAGELFCFLGPNGAGKTTTLKMLTGLARRTSGHARVGGYDIEVDPLACKRIISYIPDMPYVYERLTTTEYFEFTGDLYGVPRDRVREQLAHYFKVFGLDEYRSMLTKDLSHGLRQRLIYASTFLHDPKILFIDEPLIGLDPLTIRLIRDLLKEKTRAGMTVFLTTHILSLAEDIADRLGIIAGGRLQALGTLAEIKAASRLDGRLEDVFLKLTEVEETESAGP